MGTSSRRAQWRDGIPVTLQRSILFVAGLGLLVHEAVIRSGEPRWSLLVVYAGMMGLPLALHADDLRRILPPPSEEER